MEEMLPVEVHSKVNGELPPLIHFVLGPIVINIKKCRRAWRKVYNDPEMFFEQELNGAYEDDEGITFATEEQREQ